MKWVTSPRFRKWLILPPVLLGAGTVALLVLNRGEPKHKPREELSRVLRVIQVPVVDVVPRVLGHGTAQPGQVWRCVAEVKGRVVEAHPELKPGATINKGEELVRIDPTEYELAVAQLEAEIEEVKAQIAQLDIQAANDQASLKIEEASLAFSETELGRLRELSPSKVVSASEVDSQERSVLSQRQKVQSLKNSLNILPEQKKALEASREVRRTRLAQAQLDLKKTVIEAPFECRLGEVRIDKGQFLSINEMLFEAHATALIEIDAQVSLDQGQNLITPEERQERPLTIDMQTVRELSGIEAKVRYRFGDLTAEWDGRFAQVREQFDPQTHTVGMVIAVDKPYEKVVPGQRPPLVQGMFCEVELRGKPRNGQVVIPRSALHNGHVYLVDDSKRLERRKVEIAFFQSNFLCLKSGLQGGETLVVSDATPAIEGMLVEPVSDGELQQSLVAEATGEGELR